MGNRRHETNEDGLQISFMSYSQISEHQFNKFLLRIFEENSIEWAQKDKSGWKLRADGLKAEFPFLREISWLKGILSPLVDIQHRRVKSFDREEDRTYLKFLLTEELVDDQMPKRIFLSHKGVNKPIVRRFKDVLEAVGAHPWLDDEAMPAGAEIERSILSGFEESCAAVFFITPEFRDENFLATEINYAIAQKRLKKEKFSIVPLVFRGKKGLTGTVPSLLAPYVHKNVDNELEALNAIIRALPIKFGELGWR